MKGVSCKCFDHSPSKRLAFLPTYRSGERERKEGNLCVCYREKEIWRQTEPSNFGSGEDGKKKGEKKLMKIFPQREIVDCIKRRSEFGDGVLTNRFIDTRA